jgi:hypothetical protein
VQKTQNESEIVELLQRIAKNTSPLSLDHLSAEEKDLAFDVKIAQTPLGDIIAYEAERQGLSEDEYLKRSMKGKAKSRFFSIAELAGGQTV